MPAEVATTHEGRSSNAQEEGTMMYIIERRGPKAPLPTQYVSPDGRLTCDKQRARRFSRQEALATCKPWNQNAFIEGVVYGVIPEEEPPDGS